VVDYVGGYSLRTWLNNQLKAERFPDLRVVVSAAAQVAAALSYAHENGILHTDLKPENVLLSNESLSTDLPRFRAVVIDFGLVTHDDLPALHPREPRKIFGTLAYMSPEQIRAEPLDGRADIYSLGIMLYELVTGQLPFTSESAAELMMSHTRAEARRPQDLRPDAPNALISVIYQAMQKLTRERYETMAEVAHELGALNQTLQRTGRIDPPRLRLPVPPVREGEATVYDILPSLDRPAVAVNLIIESDGAVLIIAALDGETTTVPILTFPVLLGRAPTCNVRLDDPRVSRQHARIEQLPNTEIALMDLGSVNGTYLGGHRLEKSMIAIWDDQESARLGPYWITLRTHRVPRFDFSAEMRVTSGQVVILIENQDRVPHQFVVELREPGNVLIFAPGRSRVTVAGSDEQHLTVTVNPKRQRWIGLPAQHPVEAVIRTDGAPPHTLQGIVTVKPPVAWWAPILIVPIVITLLLYLLAGG